MAPVNHNKLNKNKTLQIVNTILGNAHQDMEEGTRHKKDFGRDACVIVCCDVGYDEMTNGSQPHENTVELKPIHTAPKDTTLY
jgi:hypothetical protein